jgi:predicted PurR-regulated permease PerM
MTNPFRGKGLRPLLPYFILAVAIIVAYMAIGEIGFFFRAAGRMWRIITPFFYGFILAYIVNIPYSGIKNMIGKIKWKFLSKRKKPLGIIVTLLLFAVLLFLVIYLIVPAIYRSVTLFVASFPAYYESALQFIGYINSLDFFGIYIDVDDILALLRDRIQGFSTEDVMSSLSALMVVPSAVFTAFLTFITSVYVMVEKHKFKAFLSKLVTAFLPASLSGTVLKYTGRINQNFKQYIRVQTIDGLILGTIVTIELFILRSPYALLLGIMLGIVNYIPYFGSIFGSLVAVIVVGFTQGFPMAVIAAIVLLITQQIDGNIIQPKLMGSSFSLSPLLVIISVTIGGAFAGVFGMIIAIPIVAVLKDILDNIIAHRESLKASITNDTSEGEV